MVVSTFEIVGMVLLAILLGVAIWWFVIAENYRKYLSTYSYARGANASKAGETLNLTCDDDKEICVYRATQICTDPDSNNYENPSTDPIASGTSSDDKYGDFSSATTVDLTSDLSGACNGKETCAYKFSPKAWPSGMPSCGGDSQLISAYACVPKGSTCQSYKSSS